MFYIIWVVFFIVIVYWGSERMNNLYDEFFVFVKVILIVINLFVFVFSLYSFFLLLGILWRYSY